MVELVLLPNEPAVSLVGYDRRDGDVRMGAPEERGLGVVSEPACWEQGGSAFDNRQTHLWCSRHAQGSSGGGEGGRGAGQGAIVLCKWGGAGPKQRCSYGHQPHGQVGGPQHNAEQALHPVAYKHALS